MKLIVATGEPAIFFAPAQDAERWMEAIDVEDGGYGAAFGPNGERRTVSTDGTLVHNEEAGEAPRLEALKAL